MPRINPVHKNKTDTETIEILDLIKMKIGAVPNLIASMANSPSVAKAYLGLNQTLSGGALSPNLREQIALLVSELNNSDYCLAAHTALGIRTGLSERETIDARLGTPKSKKERAALNFVKAIVVNRGNVSDRDIENIRKAGYADREVSEIVANVALNIFTNYFNIVAQTEIDFPNAPDLVVA